MEKGVRVRITRSGRAVERKRKKGKKKIIKEFFFSFVSKTN